MILLTKYCTEKELCVYQFGVDSSWEIDDEISAHHKNVFTCVWPYFVDLLIVFFYDWGWEKIKSLFKKCYNNTTH